MRRKRPGSLPTSLKLSDKPIEAKKTYRVTVNAFLADGGDGLTVLTKGRDKVTGMFDVEALEKYIAGAETVVAAPAVGGWSGGSEGGRLSWRLPPSAPEASTCGPSLEGRRRSYTISKGFAPNMQPLGLLGGDNLAAASLRHAWLATAD